jgi:hypothetical protein
MRYIIIIMMKNIDLVPVQLTCGNICKQCGAWFVELDNIGRLLCSIHPGVKLVDPNGQFYYSCCDRLNTSDGCTRIDHTLISFTNQSINARFNQIQQFSIMVLPDLLQSYLYMPTPRQQILYSSSTDRNENNIIQLKLPALIEAYKRFQKKNACDPLCYAAQIPRIDEQVYGNTLQQIKWKHIYSANKQTIVKSLNASSRDSELFQAELAKEYEHEMRLKRETKNVWKNASTTTTQQDDKNKSNIIISFCIISRLGNTLDVF